MKPKTYLSLLLIISISLNSFTQICFGPQQVITTNTDEACDVYACDIDNDGDFDVLSASYNDNKIAWYENTDGNGTFGTQQVITTTAIGARSVYSADLDGDNDLDVLSASEGDNKIAWYKNTDGNGTFGTQQVITTAAIGAESVFSADLDGDGDMDVLSASWFDNKIAWYENTDGNGTFGSQQVISNATVGAWSVYSADLDGDGDMDVLSASFWNDKIAWYENTDGNGTFGSQQIITTTAIGARSVYSVDLDGDDDMDVLSASRDDNKIAWYENIDGNGTFSTQQVITTTADGAWSVYSADIDGDDDLDVLSASGGDDKIAWYENTDGNGTFGTQQVITTAADGAKSVYSADLNDDGDLDVLSASFGDGKIAWYENLGPLAINEEPYESFYIFPNPTTGVLTINSKTSISQIEIYNQLGQLVLSNSNKNTINISNISKGLYFCKIKDENGNTGTQKVVKK